MGDAGESAPTSPKGKGKAAGKGAPSSPDRPLSYKERKEAELAALEESLSAESGFQGKASLTEWELQVLDHGATDQEEGLYGGRKFLPKRGYFACIRCGTVLYLAQAKFVH
mmetsp:Transcript_72511/g.135450  ORF Transcript_72511/g.135450 Transcript_72511/m.135450 type:complete len:111 (-) Transcript_72511:27-359(-)